MAEEFDWLGPQPSVHRMYGGTETIYFGDLDGRDHTYFRIEAGEEIRIPGVTTVVGVYDKSAALMQWAANMATDYIEQKLGALGLHPAGSVPILDVREWLQKARFNHKDYKENAAEIGKIAHNWLEDYIKAYIAGHSDRLCALMQTLPENEQSRNGCLAALDWMKAHKVKWIATERKVYSLLHQFAGTCDGICYITACGNAECCGRWAKVADRWERVPVAFTDVLAIADWKTSNQLHEAYNWQTAAYAMAVNEEIGPDSKFKELTDSIRYRVVARLGKDDAKFEARLLLPDTMDRDLDIFKSCLSLYAQTDKADEAQKKFRKELRYQMKQDKEEALKVKCVKADKFKGTKYPKCNDGPPCETCLRKHKEYLKEKGKNVIDPIETDGSEGREQAG